LHSWYKHTINCAICSISERKRRVEPAPSMRRLALPAPTIGTHHYGLLHLVAGKAKPRFLRSCGWLDNPAPPPRSQRSAHLPFLRRRWISCAMTIDRRPMDERERSRKKAKRPAIARRLEAFLLRVAANTAPPARTMQASRWTSCSTYPFRTAPGWEHCSHSR